MKGWYGDRYGHSLASKGVRTRCNNSYRIKSYGEWMKDVDNFFWEQFGLSSRDLPDYMWRDLYDDGLTPREAYRSNIEDNLSDLEEAGWEILKAMDEEDELSNEAHGQTKKLGTHATSYYMDYDTLHISFHGTEIVKVSMESYMVKLNTGGWFTNTTKLRMNQASNQFNLGYQVYQKDKQWFVELFTGEVIPFEGNTVTFDINPYKALGVGESPTAKNINKTMSKLEKDAEETAKDVNAGIKKLKMLAKRVKKEAGDKFNKSAEDTAKSIKKLSEKIDDSAEDTAKDISKILKVK